MDPSLIPDNPYLLLTPGPLSTTKSVRAAMLRDWCTWDADYHALVQDMRARLVRLATRHAGYTAVPMQGSGTFNVEAAIGSAIPPDGKLLVLSNGAYGHRMGQIADRLRISCRLIDSGEAAPTPSTLLERALETDQQISHVGVVHCETTSGILNPVREICEVANRYGKTTIVDAVSSFGGILLDVADWGIDFLVGSSNKCIQGVPGFGFVIARSDKLQATRGRARSLSLDLYDQWVEMDTKGGRWRFTSPTHVVRAFLQALMELEAEGGVDARHIRYVQNHAVLVDGMRALGFQCFLPDHLQSPFITTFRYPAHPAFRFERFYQELKGRGFVIYPGKVTKADTFRIGTIGAVTPADIRRLISAVAESMYWDPAAGRSLQDRDQLRRFAETGCR
jgi:2-aminoethylphosphonate-pyruvate transaminase